MQNVYIFVYQKISPSPLREHNGECLKCILSNTVLEVDNSVIKDILDIQYGEQN
jgi:hypothetical protein